MTTTQWQVQPSVDLSPDWIAAVQTYLPMAGDRAHYAAQLLWQRGIRSLEALSSFVDPQQYVPTRPAAFGAEMQAAVDRLCLARDRQERVAIWGDFDADGVTATAVLWDGLGEFFAKEQRLLYYIPHRFTESHGLSSLGLEQLAQKNCHLIITCDTGSTSHAEIEQAQLLGMEVIVTDHHTLAAARPAVVALINPRTLPQEHPLRHLAGVAVAYKLVEALYEALPTVPQRPLSRLLDLVAIGLIADLVELRGDCRYLAQVGLQQLQKNLSDRVPQRPGVARLLELCKRTGDRPTDISFGLGPRLNAVSRIHGDARFGVELLTTTDRDRGNTLALETELANDRRKALQRNLQKQVDQELAQIDLSTTAVIVLVGTQWPLGLLGLAASYVAQTTGKPAILLNADPVLPFATEPRMAQGSARSVNGVDLYDLVQDQAHLLHRFGGHPLAAGLSLRVENIPLFTAAINQRLRQHQAVTGAPPPTLTADLTVTVAELGKELFYALKVLEPCGMGNPAPRLLLQNVWFEQVQQRHLKDRRGQSVGYVKTELMLWDETVESGFPGVWWGQPREDVPTDRCDVVVELDANTHKERYEVRILAAQPAIAHHVTSALPLDLHDQRQTTTTTAPTNALQMATSPQSWQDFQPWWQQAVQAQQPLAISYPPPPPPLAPVVTWQTLVGMAKYLSRTGQTVTPQILQAKLQLGDRTFALALRTLTQAGFIVEQPAAPAAIAIRQRPDIAAIWAAPDFSQTVDPFLLAIAEEQFQRQYFAQVPLSTIQAEATAALNKPPVAETLSPASSPRP